MLKSDRQRACQTLRRVEEEPNKFPPVLAQSYFHWRSPNQESSLLRNMGPASWMAHRHDCTSSVTCHLDSVMLHIKVKKKLKYIRARKFVIFARNYHTVQAIFEINEGNVGFACGQTSVSRCDGISRIIICETKKNETEMWNTHRISFCLSWKI